MSLNLAETKLSFQDRLNQLDTLYNKPDTDPEEIAQMRLNLIRMAKTCLEDKTSPEAVRWYGWCLVTEQEGFPLNIDQGLRYINEAVMMGSLEAVTHLGDIYSGEVLTIPEDMIDFDKAIKHYDRASNANDGYASFRLAEIYSGRGPVQRDLRKALDYVEKSYNQGSAEGACLMARWIYIGEYMQQDIEKAYDLFSGLIEGVNFKDTNPKTHTQVNALFFTGLMTFYGDLGEEDPERGWEMIEEAARYGDPEANDWLQNFQPH